MRDEPILDEFDQQAIDVASLVDGADYYASDQHFKRRLAKNIAAALRAAHKAGQEEMR